MREEIKIFLAVNVIPKTPLTSFIHSKQRFSHPAPQKTFNSTKEKMHEFTAKNALVPQQTMFK